MQLHLPIIQGLPHQGDIGADTQKMAQALAIMNRAMHLANLALRNGDKTHHV
jgi:hypothetical protein